MLEKDVVVGNHYLTNQLKVVKILEAYVTSPYVGNSMTHWRCLNLHTNRTIEIKSAAKLKRVLSLEEVLIQTEKK